MTGEPTEVDEGQSVLARISTEMVRAQKEFFGKGPTQAKSYILDDMLFVVMRDGMTTAEKTMLEFGEADQVRDFRQTFENRMTTRLTGIVEELTGRRVLTYQSQVLFDPDRVIEMFVLEDGAPAGPIRATAEGQVHGEPTGEVHGDDPGPGAPSQRGDA